jgi:hypothetical protein
MKIKVVTWNMNQRSSGGNWATLREDPELADADIFLLCEATGVPAVPGTFGLTAIGNGSTKGIGCPCPGPDSCKQRKYCTAVAFAQPTLPSVTRVRQGTLLPERPSRPGSWTAAVVEIGDIAITAIALYGLNDEGYPASVRRSLSELAPILEDRRRAEYLVLGGDFNILAGKPPRVKPYPGHQVLAEIASYGLIDCLHAGLSPDRYTDLSLRTDMDHCQCGLRNACTHTRTYYDDKRPDIPYQDDYLFASPSLAARGRLRSCLAQRIGPDSPSDHAPIVAVFEV